MEKIIKDHTKKPMIDLEFHTTSIQMIEVVGKGIEIHAISNGRWVVHIVRTTNTITFMTNTIKVS